MNKTYCPLPFKEIYVSNAGEYKLCCHAWKIKGTHSAPEDVPPFEHFFSEAMEEIRDKLMQGEKLIDCNKCYEMEKYGKDSYRLKAIKQHGLLDTVRDVSLKLRINGSSCNLACYMCHPYNSSTRRKELREIWGDDFDVMFSDHNKVKFTSNDKSMKRSIWNDTIANINDHIHLVKEIHMTGGEPLQLPRHWEWIDKIPDEDAKNIDLTYDSNITQLSYKNHHVLDLKKKFKTVHFGISCDHFGEKLEYIRYPIDHKQFEENLKVIIENFPYCINGTVGLLNIDELDEIQEYYKNLGANMNFNNIVSSPRALSIRNLPDDLKEKYRQKYPQHTLVIAELNKPKHTEKWYEHMSEYMDKLYAHRKLDWRKMFNAENYRS